ncbi:NAD(P)-binding domain-containing protein [Halotalea alkalilenta]|uniref:FAD-dependent oxidoreductase n=1 Tax=Halotalea alkalilenta TaxID=376489 RepID=A0A172YBP1_9GAMM|nr:NAD(P)/FAD-dependent oxidoreductase [Halotalea alkalilenta]ANF56663.1 FAD-dependent oxidoreductase [Halotalea alkalilenta]
MPASDYRAPSSLAQLEAQVARELSLLNHPPAAWVPERHMANGERITAVVIIGAGMCGLAAAFSLARQGISDIRIIDRAAPGRTGPWLDYARMETLRSPKTLLGPAAGIPSLTFQAWYRAQFGDLAWEALDKIPRPQWQEYLLWYRDVLGIEVEHCERVTLIEPEGELLRLHVEGSTSECLLARKVVLATGREGLGAPYLPDFVKGLDKSRWAHSSEAIDFAALAGRRVAVIGMGASAMDNAAEALEHGAAEVRLLARRREMPTINKLMGIGNPGFTCAFPTLSPLWRWRIMHYSLATQTPAPHGSTLRVSRHDNAFFHFDCAIGSITELEHGLLIATRGERNFEADFLIIATGFSIELEARPELAALTPMIARWRDRFTPPAELESVELGAFPWLGDGFQFTERTPGSAPALANLHAFNYGATLSLGKVSGDIPAISVGAAWLAQSIAADLYREDIDQHWQALLAYAKPELDGSEWRDADKITLGEEPVR